MDASTAAQRTAELNSVMHSTRLSHDASLYNLSIIESLHNELLEVANFLQRFKKYIYTRDTSLTIQVFTYIK